MSFTAAKGSAAPAARFLRKPAPPFISGELKNLSSAEPTGVEAFCTKALASGTPEVSKRGSPEKAFLPRARAAVMPPAMPGRREGFTGELGTTVKALDVTAGSPPEERSAGDGAPPPISITGPEGNTFIAEESGVEGAAAPGIIAPDARSAGRF
jgi:hypothetical protein